MVLGSLRGVLSTSSVPEVAEPLTQIGFYLEKNNAEADYLFKINFINYKT